MTMTAPVPPPQRKAPRRRPTPTDAADHLLLDGVTWDFYLATLKQLERSGRRLRVTFDRGRMEIISKFDEHEWGKKLFARLIETYGTEMEIAVHGFGETTHQNPDLDRGAEPDECYFIQSPPPKLKGKPFDLRTDPPPDLIVEIDVTRSSIRREPIYAAFGVPEVWRYDGRTLLFLHLQPDGTYRPADRSAALPALSPADVMRFVQVAAAEGQPAAAWALKRWVAEQKGGRDG